MATSSPPAHFLLQDGLGEPRPEIGVRVLVAASTQPLPREAPLQEEEMAAVDVAVAAADDGGAKEMTATPEADTSQPADVTDAVASAEKETEETKKAAEA